MTVANTSTGQGQNALLIPELSRFMGISAIRLLMPYWHYSTKIIKMVNKGEKPSRAAVLGPQAGRSSVRLVSQPPATRMVNRLKWRAGRWERGEFGVSSGRSTWPSRGG